jgi:hypothetical protein
MTEFAHSLAAVIGIDACGGGIPPQNMAFNAVTHTPPTSRCRCLRHEIALAESPKSLVPTSVRCQQKRKVTAPPPFVHRDDCSGSPTMPVSICANFNLLIDRNPAACGARMIHSSLENDNLPQASVLAVSHQDLPKNLSALQSLMRRDRDAFDKETDGTFVADWRTMELLLTTVRPDPSILNPAPERASGLVLRLLPAPDPCRTEEPATR